MTYPGDPSLTPDIQDRVLTTFDQTAKLASEGKLQEARLGCDFILRLDPLFTPAKRLQDRLQSADGPVAHAADFLSAHSDQAPQEPLKTVRLSTEDLQRLIGGTGTDDSDAMPDFDEIERGPLAESQPLSGGLDAAAAPGEGGLGEATSFLAGARRAIDSGQVEAAQRLLDMAGSLDPHSPDLLDLRDELSRLVAGPPPVEGDRIAQLLADGQRAFDAERFQDAIDCWSRIFLIEIDHDEASHRIQLARDLRDEQDRQVEETFHHGVAAAESGAPDQAAAAFRRVLELRPNHMAAREHLDRLGDAGRDSAARPAPRAPATSEAPDVPGSVPKELPVAPAGPPRQADPSYRMVGRAKPKPVNPFFLIGVGVLVLVTVGGWLLYDNWDRLFPNANEEVAQAAKLLPQIVAQHDGGDLEGAITAIEEIGSDSPEYLEARRLLSRWREELEDRTVPVEPLTGDDATRHGELIVRARQAYDSSNYLEAARLFTRASAMAPLAAGEAALFDDAKRQLEPIAQQIDLYTQRQWELVLPALWRRLEQAPDDKDVHQLLVNSYFNMAVRELRRGDLPKATEHVAEAVRLERDDVELLRLEQFVTTYGQLPRDLLYEIYVQHLDFRR